MYAAHDSFPNDDDDDVGSSSFLAKRLPDGRLLQLRTGYGNLITRLRIVFWGHLDGVRV